MKNVKNVLFILAIIAFLFIAHTTYASQISYTATEVITIADEGGSTSSEDYTGIDPSSYNPHRATHSGETHIDQEALDKTVSPLYSILMWVAIVAAVITLSVIGLKFILGSASEKAEYKQHLIPFAVGVVVVAFLFTILKILSEMAHTFY